MFKNMGNDKPIRAETLTCSKCFVHCCFRMEVSSVKYRSMYITRLDQRLEFSASKDNALGTLIGQFANDICTNTAGGRFNLALAEFLVNNLMDSIHIVFSRHEYLDSEAVAEPLSIEMSVHYKPCPQQAYPMQSSFPDDIPNYVNNVQHRQANSLLHFISNSMHSVRADYQEVGTGSLNSITGIDKNTGRIIPATFVLSSLNLVEIQAIKDQSG